MQPSIMDHILFLVRWRKLSFCPTLGRGVIFFLGGRGIQQVRSFNPLPHHGHAFPSPIPLPNPAAPVISAQFTAAKLLIVPLTVPVMLGACAVCLYFLASVPRGSGEGGVLGRKGNRRYQMCTTWLQVEGCGSNSGALGKKCDSSRTKFEAYGTKFCAPPPPPTHALTRTKCFMTLR